MHDLKMLANAVRMLSVDAVERAHSGHPGMPLGMADIATVLWKKFLRHNPNNPHWFNRDRFILSNGHGSMLLYSLLHLSGYALSIEDLKNFRQLHSKTPGHPEYGHTLGVETTTGPLGQGLANAVGMAIAERILAARFNKTMPLVDHSTYVFVGDGCLMEGISHEAASLAGTLGLGKLIVFYDDNGISIDGKVESWFTDDTPARFRAYHWQVIEGVDGHDREAIEKAIHCAKQESAKPSLICCKTTIGYGSMAAGTEKVHGSPLGAEDVAHVREQLQWPYAPFEIPASLYQEWSHVEEGIACEQEWLQCCYEYSKRYPDEYYQFLRQIQGDLPDDWALQSANWIESCRQNTKAIATRKASQQCLQFYAQLLPEMIGGSADLTASNLTDWSGTVPVSAHDFKGNYLLYGVREFGMSAIMNGLGVHGGFLPYGGTFLVFADYARNAVRLSALMKQRVVFVYSHDSIGLGEDGPTHQPVEHIAMLRMTPNMEVWRPACLVETAVAWQQAIQNRHGPTALLLSRQNLPVFSLESEQAQAIARGGYVLLETQKEPDVIVIATGSELHLAVEAAKQVSERGIRVRVVSMPCCERFLAQPKAYQESVLPKALRKRIAVEAASTAYWYRFVGLEGAVLGIDAFGVSAPAQDAYQFFEITVEKLVEMIEKMGENV